jgi:hypothetical protein
MFMHRADYLTTPPDGSEVPRHATFQILVEAVTAAVEAGRLGPGDPLDLSFAIWSLVHGVVSIALKLGPGMGLDAERTLEVGNRLMFGDGPA